MLIIIINVLMQIAEAETVHTQDQEELSALQSQIEELKAAVGQAVEEIETQNEVQAEQQAALEVFFPDGYISAVTNECKASHMQSFKGLLKIYVLLIAAAETQSVPFKGFSCILQDLTGQISAKNAQIEAIQGSLQETNRISAENQQLADQVLNPSLPEPSRGIKSFVSDFPVKMSLDCKFT